MEIVLTRKIYIPISKKKRIGGPASFMMNLRAELDRVGYPYTSIPEGAKAIFFPVTASDRKIRRVKRYGGRVIQRLDGIDYKVLPKGAPDPNKAVRKIYEHSADYVVFQSEFSRRQVFQVLGEFPQDFYSIIYNGANTDIFYPSAKPSASDNFRLATSGNIRHPVMIWPILDAIDILISEGVNIQLDLIGPITLKTEGGKARILAKDYVTNVQFDDQQQLADRLRMNDAFIYTHYNSACPNSVIEATCCGLPVVGYDSGAMREVCFFNKLLLASVSENLIHDRNNYDADALLEKIRLLMSGYDEHLASARAHSEYFSMRECGRLYMDVFDGVRPAAMIASLLGKLQ